MADILMVLITWIHIFAFAVWLGGAIFFSLILAPNVTSLPPPDAGKLMGAVEKKFTPIAWTAIVAIALTGLIRMISSGTLSVAFLTGTSYGFTLLVKILIFGAIVVVGYMITSTSKKLGSASSPEEAMGYQMQIAKLSKTNIAMGIIVVLLAASLRFGGF